MNELFVGKVDRIGEVGDRAGEERGITGEKACGAQGGQNERAVGDGNGGIAKDGALHFVLMVAMRQEPGPGDEAKGDEQKEVAFFGYSLPGNGFEIVEGGQGYAGEEAVEPGPCRVIDEAIIAFAKLRLLRGGEEIVPDVAADEEAEEKEGGDDPNRCFTRFYHCEADDEQGEKEIELFFDAKRPGMGECAGF